MYGALACYIANTLCELVAVFFLHRYPLGFNLSVGGLQCGCRSSLLGFCGTLVEPLERRTLVVFFSLALRNATTAVVAVGRIVMIDVIYSNHVLTLSMVPEYIRWLH